MPTEDVGGDVFEERGDDEIEQVEIEDCELTEAGKGDVSTQNDSGRK